MKNHQNEKHRGKQTPCASRTQAGTEGVSYYNRTSEIDIETGDEAYSTPPHHLSPQQSCISSAATINSEDKGNKHYMIIIRIYP